MFARTERLLLRPGWIEDAPALTQAVAHEEVVTRLARAPWPYTLADAESYLSRPADPKAVECVIVLHEGGSTRLIGGVGLAPHGDGHELGYWLTPSAWGRGYATEAARAMIGIARHALGARRLTAHHFVDNPASGRVLAKLGFRALGPTLRFCRARDADLPANLLALDLAEEAPLPLAA